MPVVWIRKSDADRLKNNTKVSLNLMTETYRYPSVNVIGKIEGTDPKLKMNMS